MGLGLCNSNIFFERRIILLIQISNIFDEKHIIKFVKNLEGDVTSMLII